VTAAGLFTGCALPGCKTIVEQPGEVCADCLAAFGGRIKVIDTTGRTADEVAAELEQRDTETMAMYATLVELPYESSTEPPVQLNEPERKRNQVCWMCEERRTCTPTPAGWECDTCQGIQ
jgi:hypothetical protein